MTVDRILVFAPHPDDEILGCGGYLALKHTENAAVRIIIVSDGALGLAPIQPIQSSPRQQESRLGLAQLQIKDVQFWDYPDGSIPLTGQIITDYLQAVREFRPSQIMLPAPGEAHPDHRRVTRGILGALEGKWAGDVWFYETTQPAPLVNVTIDISASIETKLQALAEHASQLAQFDYVGYSDSLARMRGVASGYLRGEAFVAFPWDGSPQNFFEARPLISVVIRANDEEILAHALASLIAQEYDQIEVVLVWFGENTPDLTAFDMLALRTIIGKNNRGYNLNLGTTHAHGEYIAFLDQDDIVYPMHLALLLAEMQGRAEIDVAYAGCRVTSCHRNGTSVKVISEETLMNQTLDASRLLIGNSIANHALLFRAHIFRSLHFDETLDAYEDWELLAQLALDDYRFAQVDEITCEYRLYTEGERITLEQAHCNKGYIDGETQVYDRIVSRFKTSHLKKLADIITGLENNQQAIESNLKQATQTIAGLETELKEKEAWQTLLKRTLPALGIDKVGHRGLAKLIGTGLATEQLFSILIPVYNTPADILTETIGSIIGQNYPGWELCLVDDGSTEPETLIVLEQIKNTLQHTGKLHFVQRKYQGGIVAATNDALALATAPYIAFVDHDDLLHEDALLEIALILKQEALYKLIYTDSTMIDMAGRLMHIYRKPDWSPETLYHLNFINHFTVIQRELALQIGGLTATHEGSQDWDLLLRITNELAASEIRHIRIPLYAWRATEQSVAYHSSAKPEAFNAGMNAVKAHLQRKSLEQPHCSGNLKGSGVICNWNTKPRTVEIIIPTHNNLEGLKICIDGILKETDYSFIKVTVIANRCSDPEMLIFLDYLVTDCGVNLVIDDRPFNWAALNNFAAASSDSDLLLFMNDDVEIQSSDWLTLMNQYFELDGVGVVGATLFYPDGELQHNGVHTHPVWVADNIRSTGSYNELSITRNVAAVTGACLLVSRHIFDEIGGFDERFAVNYNDVDFCLATRHAGYRIVQAAVVTMIHHESASRGITDSLEKNSQWQHELTLMRDKWGDFLFDPYWSYYEIHAHGTRILHVA